MNISRRTFVSALAISAIVTPQAFAQDEGDPGGAQAKKGLRAKVKQPATTGQAPSGMKQPSKQKPGAIPEPIPTPKRPAGSPVPQPVPTPK